VTPPFLLLAAVAGFIAGRLVARARYRKTLVESAEALKVARAELQADTEAFRRGTEIMRTWIQWYEALERKVAAGEPWALELEQELLESARRRRAKELAS
jgi:hypothetical protein